MKTKIILSAIAMLFFLGLTSSSFAQEHRRWNKHHPRRHQVNQRLANQNRQIMHKEANGQMSRAEAINLHRQDRHIRHEERRMAAQDNGHITKQDQNKLNRQENNVHREIKNN